MLADRDHKNYPFVPTPPEQRLPPELMIRMLADPRRWDDNAYGLTQVAAIYHDPHHPHVKSKQQRGRIRRYLDEHMEQMRREEREKAKQENRIEI